MIKCDKCGSKNTEQIVVFKSEKGSQSKVVCNDCGNINKPLVFKGKA